MSREDLILLVEDSSTDAQIVELAFKNLPKRFRLRWLSSGDRAIEYLAFSNRASFPTPKAILLDLAMPGTDGFEVLEWIRDQPQFKGLPVIVLTNSPTAPAITRAYSSGANSFIPKPSRLAALIEELRNALEYWVPEKSSHPPFLLPLPLEQSGTVEKPPKPNGSA